MRDTEFLDLSESALLRVLQVLDLESLLTVARVSKKLNETVKDEVLWMERCRQWEGVVDLATWRASMDSGRSLFRALRSFGRLAGIWAFVDIDEEPRGVMIYVTWGTGGVEGWSVTQYISQEYAENGDVNFSKLFDVIARPDGSHTIELIWNKSRDSLCRASAEIVLPSLTSPSETVLVTYHNSLEEVVETSDFLRRNFDMDRSPDSSPEDGKPKEWRSSLQRVEYGSPTPERELTGLWTGEYEVGWEILNVSYSDDGFIVGTKVTGDRNVPTGEISFRATTEMAPIDFQDIEVDTSDDPSNYVTKKYIGQGKIGDSYSSDQSWVPGLLVVYSNGDFHFSWKDNGNVHFRRLNLEAEFEEWISGRTLQKFNRFPRVLSPS